MEDVMKSTLKKSGKQKNNLSKTINNNRKQNDYTLIYQEKNKDVFTHLREHEFMLIDKLRVDAYHAAISRFVHQGDTVIDLGTGVGILAFFAAKQGAKKVYAIDHSDIISVANRVAKFNKIKNIEFIQTHSKQLALDSPVDVIVHEQMGNFLFEEHMVDNICDLRDRLLKKDGRIIPNKFELFIEPVKVIDSHHVPMIREMKIHGIDFSCVKEKGVEELYAFIWRNDPASIEYFLCNPEPVYSFNLQTINPEDIPNSINYSRVVCHGGRLDGFIVYFHSIFDSDIYLSSGPVQNRGKNWKYWLLRVESVIFKTGDVINFQIKADDLKFPATWKWKLK